MENIEAIKKLISNDRNVPAVLKGLTITECNSGNMTSVKYAKAKTDAVSYVPIEMNYYKPISKCFKISE